MEQVNPPSVTEWAKSASVLTMTPAEVRAWMNDPANTATISRARALVDDLARDGLVAAERVMTIQRAADGRKRISILGKNEETRF